MSIGKPTIRSLLTIITLAVLTPTASGLTLAIHLYTDHGAHHCYNDKHTQNEPSQKSEQQKNSQNHHSCPICQVLLGSSGKYFCETTAEINFILTQSNSTHQYITTFTSQYHPTSVVPRGPPLS